MAHNTKKITQEDFILRAKIIHNEYYEYNRSLYVNSQTHVIITCPIHGEFKQKPAWHLSGSGCKQCGIETIRKQKQKTQTEYIKQLKKVHNNKYDYSEFHYKDNHTKANIICKTHGKFAQMPYAHMAGKGCPDCGGTKKLNTNQFIEKAKKIHNNFYTYQLVQYKNNREKIIITCPIHGHFAQIPNSHLNGMGCKQCQASHGEKKISNFLKEHNIIFKEEQSFQECKFDKKLRFDFFIPKLNMCIEYDGIQHYEPVKNWGGLNGFEKIKHRDKIKDDFCKSTNKKLIRISYKEKNNIDKILTKHLKISI